MISYEIPVWMFLLCMITPCVICPIILEQMAKDPLNTQSDNFSIGVTYLVIAIGMLSWSAVIVIGTLESYGLSMHAPLLYLLDTLKSLWEEVMF